MNLLLSQYKALRISKGISQSRMAEVLGLANKSSISAYEAERRKPSLSIFLNMLSIIGYELAIIPKGMRNVAMDICKGKAELDGVIQANKTEDFKVFLKEMKELRILKKMSQATFADFLGVGNSTMICQYENGNTNPTINRMDEMLNILGYELAIVPKGYRDFARTVCEEKAKMDSNKEE